MIFFISLFIFGYMILLTWNPKIIISPNVEKMLRLSFDFNAENNILKMEKRKRSNILTFFFNKPIPT